MGTVEQLGPRAGPLRAFFVQPLAVGGLSPAARLDPWRQSERRCPSTRVSSRQGRQPSTALHRASVSPDPRGASQHPLTTFFLPRKVQNKLGAGSDCGRRPRAAGLYAWHCLRERPRRRGPQEDGDGADGAGWAGLRPRLLLQAGRRGAAAAADRGRGRALAGKDVPGRRGWPRGGRYLLFGALRTRPAAFVFFLAKSPSKGSTEA